LTPHWPVATTVRPSPDHTLQHSIRSVCVMLNFCVIVSGSRHTPSAPAEYTIAPSLEYHTFWRRCALSP
jgi:hypothetical protein